MLISDLKYPRASNMSDTIETGPVASVTEPERQAGEVSASRRRTPSAGTKSGPLTPPPASAPSEFLEVQNPPSPSNGALPVTPPPASVPSEFLSEQEHKVSLAETPASRMVDYLDSQREPPAEYASGVWPPEAVAEEPPEVATEEVAAAEESMVRLRGLPLMPGEELSRMFLPDEGTTDAMPRSGPALILTNERLIAFRGVEGFRDTHFAALSDISQYSVRTGQRNWGAVLQGFLMMISGAFLYVVVAYWLAGQISGPNVPVINIDVAPLIALIIILAGLLVLLQNYFTRPAGAVIFRGSGMEIAFPFRSALDIDQIYGFVNEVRQAAAKHSPRLQA